MSSRRIAGLATVSLIVAVLVAVAGLAGQVALIAGAFGLGILAASASAAAMVFPTAPFLPGFGLAGLATPLGSAAATTPAAVSWTVPMILPPALVLAGLLAVAGFAGLVIAYRRRRTMAVGLA